MKRTAGVIAASLLMVGVSAVSPAAADPPTVTMYRDAGTTYRFPDPELGYAHRCDFPVLYQDEGNALEIQFAGGRYFMTSPGLRATVTNLDTGASIDLNVNGSVRITQTPVGTEGHYLEVMAFGGPSIDLSPGQMTWYTGRNMFVTEYDEHGNPGATVKTYTGPTLDVCAALTP